jgi:hypothetical protein
MALKLKKIKRENWAMGIYVTGEERRRIRSARKRTGLPYREIVLYGVQLINAADMSDIQPVDIIAVGIQKYTKENTGTTDTGNVVDAIA